jgi:hypothetical protein
MHFAGIGLKTDIVTPDDGVQAALDVPAIDTAVPTVGLSGLVPPGAYLVLF